MNSELDLNQDRNFYFTMDKEKIKVFDQKGFHYEVEIRYQTHFGLAFAYYEERPICNVEYGRIMPPYSDNDAEWERYEELFSEFRDRTHIDLIPKCQEHFNQ